MNKIILSIVFISIYGAEIMGQSGDDLLFIEKDSKEKYEIFKSKDEKNLFIKSNTSTQKIPGIFLPNTDISIGKMRMLGNKLIVSYIIQKYKDGKCCRPEIEYIVYKWSNGSFSFFKIIDKNTIRKKHLKCTI